MTINNFDEQNILYTRFIAPSAVDVFMGGYDAAGDSMSSIFSPSSSPIPFSRAHLVLFSVIFFVLFPPAPPPPLSCSLPALLLSPSPSSPLLLSNTF